MVFEVCICNDVMIHFTLTVSSLRQLFTELIIFSSLSLLDIIFMLLTCCYSVFIQVM